MANRPGRRTEVEAPARCNDDTFAYVDDSIAAMMVLLRDPNYPLIDIQWMKTTRGTDGGISVNYSAKGVQYNRHVTKEEILARYQDQVEPKPEVSVSEEEGARHEEWAKREAEKAAESLEPRNPDLAAVTAAIATQSAADREPAINTGDAVTNADLNKSEPHNTEPVEELA